MHLRLHGERRSTGIVAAASARDFKKVMQLLSLCPGEPELNLLEKTIGRHLPSLHFWTEQERAGCAYFAVVLLDRRIAFSREIAQQGES